MTSPLIVTAAQVLPAAAFLPHSTAVVAAPGAYAQAIAVQGPNVALRVGAAPMMSVCVPQVAPAVAVRAHPVVMPVGSSGPSQVAVVVPSSATTVVQPPAAVPVSVTHVTGAAAATTGSAPQRQRQERTRTAADDSVIESAIVEAARQRQAGLDRHVGSVVCFGRRRGYGFIDSATALSKYGCQVFIHHTRAECLTTGTVVSFAVTKTAKGPQAVDVEVIYAAPALSRRQDARRLAAASASNAAWRALGRLAGAGNAAGSDDDVPDLEDGGN
eukprot:TRINITY_DN8730_c0_g1_i1.p1 TRINITY_DN8730_c0_g1~~TRINITY_DN8730_c0_g1_i1.p1  ORF type:complete len:301 (+),score=31.96 TRINITY_DN8730_c0_g1_i1:90-905(+)